MLNGYQGKVYTVDARKISVQALGKYFPNSPMLAAAVAVSGVMKNSPRKSSSLRWPMRRSLADI